ncbi:hypothetical protein DL98DRAFT_577322 [Cadophora sp. DSE1049]|nr:hypothetical protein DL98DRAFT_577322 [Cadophora sp. DSE1049]
MFPAASNLSWAQALTQSATSLPIHAALGLNLISQTSSPQPTAVHTFTSAPIHLTPSQTLHGGIASLMIDAAGYEALIPTLSEGQTAVTIASAFQILDAVPGLGKVYEVEGRVVRRGKRTAFCEGEVNIDQEIEGEDR